MARAGARATKSVPTVAFLSNGSLNSRADQVEAFKRGLTESGYRIGQNIAVEYYWAEDRDDALPLLADEAVRRKPAVIVASSGTSAVLAAKAATSTIPIVFCVGEIRLGIGWSPASIGQAAMSPV